MAGAEPCKHLHLQSSEQNPVQSQCLFLSEPICSPPGATGGGPMYPTCQLQVGLRPRAVCSLCVSHWHRGQFFVAFCTPEDAREIHRWSAHLCIPKAPCVHSFQQTPVSAPEHALDGNSHGSILGTGSSDGHGHVLVSCGFTGPALRGPLFNSPVFHGPSCWPHGWTTGHCP